MIYIGGDHAGFELKEHIKRHLKKNKVEFIDLGPVSLDPLDDYPEYAKKVAKKISGKKDMGILVCGSGMGVSMAANRFKGVRAALVYSKESAFLSRAHNDSNIICLGGRELTKKLAITYLNIWFNTPFSSAARHHRRVRKIDSSR